MRAGGFWPIRTLRNQLVALGDSNSFMTRYINLQTLFCQVNFYKKVAFLLLDVILCSKKQVNRRAPNFLPAHLRKVANVRPQLGEVIKSIVGLPERARTGSNLQ